MTRIELCEKMFGDDAVCAICPWTLNKVDKPRVATCEGLYCETAIDSYIEENNIKIEE